MSSKLASAYVACGSCGIKIPASDADIYRDRGSCPVGCPWTNQGKLEEARVDVSLKPKANKTKTSEKKEDKKQKRWAEITTKGGHVYYHNSSTGEDRWDNR